MSDNSKIEWTKKNDGTLETKVKLKTTQLKATYATYSIQPMPFPDSCILVVTFDKSMRLHYIFPNLECAKTVAEVLINNISQMNVVLNGLWLRY